jgi:hypothetical protein
MGAHVHTKFTDNQVKELLQKYVDNSVERKYLQEILGIKKAMFFRLLKNYREDPLGFSVEYKRAKFTRTIDPEIKDNIVKELAIDKTAIKNKAVPLYKYNYSYVQKRLERKYKQTASIPTIIRYAKINDCYLPKRKKAKTHEREVLTTHIGELIQHDASVHLWAPDSGKKWTLITSLDDYSRCLLYAQFVEHESS